tara:strand:- start:58 stop:477 length:420 start_codon:yes stop_codon:yes gene_type:complete
MKAQLLIAWYFIFLFFSTVANSEDLQIYCEQESKRIMKGERDEYVKSNSNYDIFISDSNIIVNNKIFTRDLDIEKDNPSVYFGSDLKNYDNHKVLGEMISINRIRGEGTITEIIPYEDSSYAITNYLINCSKEKPKYLF